MSSVLPMYWNYLLKSKKKVGDMEDEKGTTLNSSDLSAAGIVACKRTHTVDFRKFSEGKVKDGKRVFNNCIERSGHGIIYGNAYVFQKVFADDFVCLERIEVRMWSSACWQLGAIPNIPGRISEALREPGADEMDVMQQSCKFAW